MWSVLRLRCDSVLRLADGVSTNLVHGGAGNPSSGVIGSGSSQTGRTAVLLAAGSFGFHVSGARRARRAGSAVRCPRYRHLRHDGSGHPDCCKPFGPRKAGSVGQPAGPEIAILDSEGRRLPPGRRGEIALRGPTITRGYDNDAAETASAFRDGWFRTGDLGYLDADGYLFIVGRIKEIIHQGGQKVAPAEVEEALLSHPDVIEAAVFSVPHGRLGADVAAAVVLRPNAKVSAERLRDFARERLVSFKVPGLIRMVPEIPKGAGGKIKRSELAAAFSNTQPAAGERGGKLALPGSELERQLAEIWSEILDIDQIGIDQDVFALGVDSHCGDADDFASARNILVSISHSRTSSMHPRLRLSRFALSSSKKCSTNLSTKLARSASGNRASRKEMAHSRYPSCRSACCGSRREIPGLPQFNLPFAYRLRGPLNVIRTRAEPCRGRASARFAAHGI